MAEATTRTTDRIAIGELARRGVTAIVIALLGNALVLAVARELLDLAPDLQALAWGPVILFTTLGVVGAAVVYAILTRYVSDPNRTFTTVAAVALAVSLLPDLGLLANDPAATIPSVAALMIMHGVAAAASVAALTGRVSA